MINEEDAKITKQHTEMINYFRSEDIAGLEDKKYYKLYRELGNVLIEAIKESWGDR